MAADKSVIENFCDWLEVAHLIVSVFAILPDDITAESTFPVYSVPLSMNCHEPAAVIPPSSTLNSFWQDAKKKMASNEIPRAFKIFIRDRN